MEYTKIDLTPDREVEQEESLNEIKVYKEVIGYSFLGLILAILSSMGTVTLYNIYNFPSGLFEILFVLGFAHWIAILLILFYSYKWIRAKITYNAL